MVHTGSFSGISAAVRYILQGSPGPTHPGCERCCRWLVAMLRIAARPCSLTEPGVPPRKKVLSEFLIQKFSLDQQSDHSAAENFNHRPERREWDVEERPFVVESTLQDEGMEMRIPPEHCRDRSSASPAVRPWLSPKVW